MCFLHSPSTFPSSVRVFYFDLTPRGKNYRDQFVIDLDPKTDLEDRSIGDQNLLGGPKNMLDCVIIYPDLETGVDSISDLRKVPIKEYEKVWKVGVCLPVLNSL